MKALSIALLTGGLWVVASAGVSWAGMPATVLYDQQGAGQSGEAGAPSLEGLQAQAEAHPQAVDAWWQLATAAYEADRFQQAVPALKRVLSVQPRMGIAWNLLGLSEFELRNYGSARSDLEHAATLQNTDDAEVEHVAAYHLGLLLIHDASFEPATALLLKTFTGAANPQVKYALGLAALRVPLLPSEVDPSREATLQEVGTLVARGSEALPELAAYAAAHPELPGVEGAYGAALIAAGKLPEALAAYQAEAKRAPRNQYAWQKVAQLATQLSQTKEASLARSRAASLQSDGAFLQAQRQLFAVGSLAAVPDRESWSGAMQAYAQGQYALAARGLSTWLAAHPEDGTSWAVLGLSEFALHNDANALLHLQRGSALGLHGKAEDVESARYTTGILLLQAGQFEQASDLLAATAKLMPGDTRLVYALGLALLHRAQLPQPGEPEAALVVPCGEIALQLRDSRYDDAFARFKVLLAQYPQVPFLHYSYGTALIALSEFPEAAVQMRKEQVLSPQSALPLLRLASIALREHTPGEALGPATEALARAPGSAEAHYLRGRALLETGDQAGAIRELEAARNLNASSPEIHFALARAYARANMADAAARERAIFAQLSEASEAQKPGSAEATYAGPRDSGGLHSGAATVGQP